MAEQQYRCRGCGAPVQYQPGTEGFHCPYCGAEQVFQATGGTLEEQPYTDALAEALAKEPTEERLTVKCGSCGAQFTFPDNVVGERCSFCGSPIVATAVSTRTVRARAVLPFKIGAEQAASAFRAWVGSLWFAPSALKRDARGDRIDGVYLPYWTFDAKTTSTYTGQRGTDYTETETYSTTEGGRAVTRTREVTKTRWSTVSGQVARDFDDVLVVATRVLPEDKLDQLEPWHLADLAPASDEYLAGYRTLSYTVPLAPALATARQKMKRRIERDVESDIGGDHQRILSLATQEREVTFKHVLLPLWLSCYRFGNRTFRFMVNARTGEVEGDRPWSWVKITLAVLVALLVAGLIIHIVAAN